jgi:hypothetical protein
VFRDVQTQALVDLAVLLKVAMDNTGNRIDKGKIDKATLPLLELNVQVTD